MSDQDPFAAVPADEANTESVFDAPPADAPKKAAPKKAAPKSDEGKITVTLKGGSGFDAPWIVNHFNDLDEALELFHNRGRDLATLMERVQAAGQHFASQGKPSGGGNGGGGGSSAPRGAQEPPAGTPAAPGPDWQFKSGSKNGKPWKAWFPPRGSDEKPVWL